MIHAMAGPEMAALPAEEDLVADARRGDRQAFDRLVEMHTPRVWRVVWRILRHREDAEDVVQEVFLAAHGALHEFRGEARFTTWLHSIAVRRALNARRSAAGKASRSALSLVAGDGVADAGTMSEGRLADPAPTASPLRALEAGELRRRLAECVQQLPASWRAVLALREGESLSYQEIATILKTALGTVRSRLARARLALRRCVEGSTT
jgi:RNA polymerase sigma-70 factor (ECF subfamily)